MAVKEELLALIIDAKRTDPETGSFTEYLADFLVANGVTVQDRKPLEAFLHPIDTYSGLKAKCLVFKADTGQRVENCFVLRPDKDKAAVEALRSYANATGNRTLSNDIHNWVGKGGTAEG